MEETWALLAEPLENLRVDAVERPALSWAERRETLLRELSEVHAGPVAEQLVGWLDELPDADRTTLLSSDDLLPYAYQVVSGALAEPSAAEQQDEQYVEQPVEQQDEHYDEQAWFGYLAENGGRWDGTDESWAGFRDWFQYYATEAGVGTPATLLLDHLGRMPPAERVAAFAEYGVTIEPPEPVAAPDPRVQLVMDRLLARNPEYAEIPEAHRIEMVTAILERQESNQ